MNRLAIWSAVVLLSFALTGCGQCEHEYDDGVVTKEPTCTEEGEKTFTCSLCEETRTESVPKTEHTYKEEVTKEPTFEEEGEKTFTCEVCGDQYTESIPVRDDEVVITVTSKTNLPKDVNEFRFSDRVVLTFEVENKTDKMIKGVQGNLIVRDLFGEDILKSSCDFTGHSIPAGESITVDELGMDINEFMENHAKFYNTDFSDLQFEYEVTNIVYDGDSGAGDESSTESAEDQKVTVKVTDKQSLGIDYNAGRFSPWVEFSFEVYNNTSKDIKGVQGVLTIKDLFGEDIMSSNLDFTGQTIEADGSVTFSGLGIELNQFMNEHAKVYNAEFEDLNFEYKVTSIVYTDGTTE